MIILNKEPTCPNLRHTGGYCTELDKYLEGPDMCNLVDKYCLLESRSECTEWNSIQAEWSCLSSLPSSVKKTNSKKKNKSMEVIVMMKKSNLYYPKDVWTFKALCKEMDKVCSTFNRTEKAYKRLGKTYERLSNTYAKFTTT